MISRATFMLRNAQGSFSLEYALFVSAAVVAAAATLPIFFRRFGGYLGGFHE